MSAGNALAGETAHPARPWLAAASALALVALVLTLGCVAFRRPEVVFRGVAVGSFGSGGLNLEANLDVLNPNSYKIGVEKLTYRLTVNGDDVGAGAVEQPTSLPAKTTTAVHLPLVLNWSKVKFPGLDLLAGGIDYAIEGEVTFSTPVGVFHRPYRHEGRYAPLASGSGSR